MRRRDDTVWMFALVFTSVGFGVYVALGLVIESALGLAPLAFLVAGGLFVVTMLTYTEGASMLRERGGSGTFARHAFNELVSFIAGWAVLIDYLVILALAALATAAYLGPVPGLGEGMPAELPIAIAVIALSAFSGLRAVTSRGRSGLLALLAAADIALQILIVILGALVIWQPELVTGAIDFPISPSFEQFAYGVAIALIAYAGIEAATDLAPDVFITRRALRRIVWSGAAFLPLSYAAIAFVALMAAPVVATPEGPVSELGAVHVQAPLLGVAAALDPSWLADASRWIVVAIVVPTLVWAAALTMLGLSRHVYTLAINRQIPSWLGRLGGTHGTPGLAILISAVLATLLVLPRDFRLLAEIYALGATLAIAIAHLSIIALRRSQPERSRPFRVPLGVGRWAPGGVPLPAVLGAGLAVTAFVGVVALHDAARWIGGAWMAFGLVGYAVYRKTFEGTSLTKRITVPAEDLTRSVPEASYRTILVPVLGSDLDDDIVGTAGRLAAVAPEGVGRTPARLSLVHVVEVPLARGLEAPLADEAMERANAAIERARQVALEYPDVDVTARVLRARSIGAGIVAAAKEEAVEAIVIGGEPPSQVRGGAIYGGIGGRRPPEIGPVTEYVLSHAPCRVLLTAPPDPGGPPDWAVGT